jgi:hypothetical protein
MTDEVDTYEWQGKPGRPVKHFPITAEIVEGFAASCLTKFFDDASRFEDFHREWWRYCTNDTEKFVAICAPRG